MWWHRRTYLDAAAGISGNASSPHEEGRRAKDALEGARTAIARLLEVQPDDVVFTGGGTEANALAILGHVRALHASGKNNIRILYLPSAHASVVGNVMLAAEYGAKADPLPVSGGRVDTAALADMLQADTALVTMDAVCGETGVIWNTREVAQALAGKGIVLHVDASQAPLTEKITRAHFGADMLTFDASKVSEVRGVGILIAHRTIALAPLYGGGGQERGLRPGSEAPEPALKFASALARAVQHREIFRAKAIALRGELVRALFQKIPSAIINEGRLQAPNIVNISLPGRDTDYLVALLDEAGFAVSTKSACETDSSEGSRAVFALFNDRARAESTLRISWGPEVKARDLRRFAHALGHAVAFIDSSTQR